MDAPVTIIRFFICLLSNQDFYLVWHEAVERQSPHQPTGARGFHPVKHSVLDDLPASPLYLNPNGSAYRNKNQRR